MKGYLHSLETMGLVDGPGGTRTIFSCRAVLCGVLSVIILICCRGLGGRRNNTPTGPGDRQEI